MNLIKNILLREFNEALLIEGRVDDAKKKYGHADVVDYFVETDPSGKNKYLDWEMRIFTAGPYNTDIKTAEFISKLINGFHKNIQNLEKKDINQYKSLIELEDVVEPLIQKSQESLEKKQKIDTETKKLYEDSDWLLVKPLSHKSSCKYGAGTQWCTTEKDDPVHFDNYTSSGILIYLIHKKSNHKFAFHSNMTIGSKSKSAKDFIVFNEFDTDVYRDVSVDGFFKKLVKGEMGFFIMGADADEEGSIPLFKIECGDCRRDYKEGEAYSEENLISEIMSMLLYGFYFKKGRNSFKYIQEVFNKFGLTIKFETEDYGGPEKRYVVYYKKEVVFSVESLKNIDVNLYDFLMDEIVDYDYLMKHIVKNNIPIRVIDLKKELSGKFLNVMSKEQAIKMMSAIKLATDEEYFNKIEKYNKDLVDFVKRFQIEISKKYENVNLKNTKLYTNVDYFTYKNKKGKYWLRASPYDLIQLFSNYYGYSFSGETDKFYSNFGNSILKLISQ